MPTTTQPDSFANFDWIAVRAKCTSFSVFEVLRGQVKQDMESRNALNTQIPANKTFSFQSPNGHWFAVVYQAHGVNKGVIFKINENGVTAEDIESQKLLCNGILVISDDGQCRLRVGQVECDLWQFRKLALHDLFFVNQEIVR
jgi:hypothetical protein